MRSARLRRPAAHLVAAAAVLAGASFVPGAAPVATAAVTACTPTTTTDGTWTYVAFTDVGECEWTLDAAGVASFDYLVVAGGGGGGRRHAGGGGAGGMLTGSGAFGSSSTMTIGVGDGGLGAPSTVGNVYGPGDDGDNSTLAFTSACSAEAPSTITALGGGKGSTILAAGNGGSGGAAMSGDSGSGTPLQGNAGGNYVTYNPYAAGGGGGAGAIGGDATSTAPLHGGHGGDGLAWLPGEFTPSIASELGLSSDLASGGDVYFAGGGGGGADLAGSIVNMPGGDGGLGGGGAGGEGGADTSIAADLTPVYGKNAVANSGGGGGGGGLYDTGYATNSGATAGGDGGSGIVIIRYNSSETRDVLCVVPDARSITAGTTPAPAPATYLFTYTDTSVNRTPVFPTIVGDLPECASAFRTTDLTGATHPIYCAGGSSASYIFDTSATSTLTVGPAPGQIAGCGLLTIWESGTATEFVGKIPDAVSAADQTVVTVTLATAGADNTGQIFPTDFETNPVADGAYSLDYVGADSGFNTVALWGPLDGSSVTVDFSAEIADPVIISNYVGNAGAMDFGDADIVVLDGAAGVAASDHRVNLSSLTAGDDAGWAVQVKGIFGPGAPLEFTYFDRTADGTTPTTGGLAIAKTAPTCTPITSTTDALSSSSITSTDSITATATVAAASGTIDPTGTVGWYYCYDATTTPTTCDSSNWTLISSSTLVDGTSGDGTATADMSAWTPGTLGEYVVRAKYNGDSTYLVSTSGSDALTVTDATPETRGQITNGTSTCAAFAADTAPTLSTIQYSMKGSRISQVSAGVFLYWAEWTVSEQGSVNEVAVTQTLPDAGWSRYLVQAAGSQLYDSSCRTVKGVSISTTGANTSIRTGTLRPGTYYLVVKYAATSVVGMSNPISGKTYTFTSSLGAATTGIDFVLKR